MLVFLCNDSFSSSFFYFLFFSWQDFLHQILSGLDYCHSHNILHRGLNPGSLMLDHRSQSTVKIAGFGSARTFGVPAGAYTEGGKVQIFEKNSHSLFTTLLSGIWLPSSPRLWTRRCCWACESLSRVSF